MCLVHMQCLSFRVSSVASIQEDRLNEESIDDIDETENGQNNSEEAVEEPVEETAMPVPQVKVGPDGSLILDEQSLVRKIIDGSFKGEKIPIMVIFINIVF